MRILKNDITSAGLSLAFDINQVKLIHIEQLTICSIKIAEELEVDAFVTTSAFFGRPLGSFVGQQRNRYRDKFVNELISL